MKNVRIGYACISMIRQDLKVNREIKMVTINKFKNAKDMVKHLRDLSRQNVIDMFEIIKENVKNGIRFYRMTSCLFPHMTNTIDCKSSYFAGDMKFVADIVADIRKFALAEGVRLTFHSQPYFHLESENKNTLKQTLRELKMYNTFLDMLGLPDMCIIVHVGRNYERFIEVYNKLKQFGAKKENVVRYVVVENTENNNDAETLLNICEKHGIPYCFDFFHNQAHISKIIDIDEKFIMRCVNTFAGRMVPKFHVSEQDKSKRRGAHAEYVSKLPDSLMKFIGSHPEMHLDIMLEAKAKDIAVLKLLENMKN
jgi:UV DNA damage endonuclease